MTLATNQPLVEVIGDGFITNFNIAMEVIEGTSDDVMEVYVGGILLTVNVDYAIVEGIPDRDIVRDLDFTFTVAPAAASTVSFKRVTPRLQEADFGTSTDYGSQTHENQADNTMMALQEVDYDQQNPSVIPVPTNYPTGANKYAVWSDNGSVLESDTAPMTYDDGRTVYKDDIFHKEGQVWWCQGDTTAGGAPFITNYNNFNGEVNLGFWKGIIGQQGEQGPPGVQGAQGGMGNTGPIGPSGNEKINNLIFDDVVNEPTGIFMSDQTVRMDVEIIRTDSSEERQIYMNLIAMNYAGSWQIKIVTSSQFGGNPIGVSFVIAPGINELLYTSDNMTGVGYVGTMRMYLWRFD